MPTERIHVDALIALRRMSILNVASGSGHEPVFDKLASMKVIGIALVMGNSADISSIVASNKHRSLNAHPCQLTDKGTLTPRFFASPESASVTSQPPPKAKEDSKLYDGFTISAQPEDIIISYLRHRYPLGIGGVVYDSQGNAISLVREALVNADSITYATNRPGLWAKIYSP